MNTSIKDYNRVVLDAKPLYAIYRQRFNEIKSYNLAPHQIHNNYIQLVTMIFERINVNNHDAMLFRIDEASIGYYSYPDDNNSIYSLFINELNQCYQELCLIIMQHLYRHHLMEGNSLSEYYLYLVTESMIVVNKSVVKF